MSDKSSSSSSGIGFAGALTVLFVGLKLTGYIDWSWWWVLIPVWGGVGLVLTVLLVAFVVWLLREIWLERRAKARRKKL